MGLRLYDSRTRQVRDFEPLTPGVVTIYVCGATVQAPPHIGHVRAAIAFDILRRYLATGGTNVIYATNVTDIDDKILHNASHEGAPWWALAERNTREFREGYAALGVLPPTVEPHATGHIPEMLDLIQRLMDKDHAYASGGDVYFNVRSDPSYGELSNQNIDNLQQPEDLGAKRDPLDFALWKGAKPDEPSWDTPWGPGRPGWHLECSAMATKYLGAEFDIHGGGLDLVFPHHENELAQSRCAGDPFARLWMHNGLVNVGAEKMSKSLGNSLIVSDLIQHVRPVVLRYYLGAPHYRSSIDWSEEGVAEAAAAYGRLEGFIERAIEMVGSSDTECSEADPEATAAFLAAMDDDLGVPQALAVIHNAARAGNTALAAGDKDAVRRQLDTVRSLLMVLGLDPITQWSSARTDDRLHDAVDALVRVVLDQRAAARERKDYAAADAIRDALADAGIVVEDTPDGPRWSLADADDQ
ncbi:MAG: cysteinyl-tRNA synthetase [Frankiales bacterium]|nr:cysteinyl-tRNA synthetase [Frankiales bacterium]